MRSLFAKFFFCMLLVPVLARGGGLLLYTAFGDPQPDTERMMRAVLPLYAETVGAAFNQGGPAAAGAVLAAAARRTGSRVSLLSRVVRRSRLREPDRRMAEQLGPPRIIAVPVPDARGAAWPLCLIATSHRDRASSACCRHRGGHCCRWWNC